MGFSFIHAADIHLDSPMQGLSNYDGAPYEQLRSVTRKAFESLIQAALDHKVDFVIIAGDLYDREWKDYSPGLFFSKAISQLQNIPVYLLYGNHDAEKKMTKKIKLPQNVNVFNAQNSHSYTLPNHPVILHGQSFEFETVTDNIAHNYPSPDPNKYNIGILHTGLEGGSQHANYAPCSLKELQDFGYQYWALGHIHKGEVLSEAPYIVYSGCLQGRHIKECGRKGAVLVEVDNQFTTKLTHLYFDHIRWEELPIQIDDAESFEDVQEIIQREIEILTHCEHHSPELFAVRVLLKGVSTLHPLPFSETLEFIRDVATNNVIPTWIEDVKFRTEAHVKKTKLSPIILTIIEQELEKALQEDLYEDFPTAQELSLLQKALPRNLAGIDDFQKLNNKQMLSESLLEAYQRLLNELQKDE
jgi:DNA repair protein SbcD/Mre11